MAYEPVRVLEHRSTRGSRWLRENRLRLALWVALVEGILVAFRVVHWAPALLVAAVVVAFYFWVGHRLRYGVARELAWTAAVSQALVALVPLLVVVIGTLALIAVGVIAVVVLAVLLTGRR